MVLGIDSRDPSFEARRSAEHLRTTVRGRRCWYDHTKKAPTGRPMRRRSGRSSFEARLRRAPQDDGQSPMPLVSGGIPGVRFQGAPE